MALIRKGEVAKGQRLLTIFCATVLPKPVLCSARWCLWRRIIRMRSRNSAKRLTLTPIWTRCSLITAKLYCSPVTPKEPPRPSEGSWLPIQTTSTQTCAQILFRRREYAHARAFYERALRLRPRSAEAAYGLAQLDLAAEHRKTRVAALKKSYPDGCSMPTRTARSQSLMKNLVSNRKPFASARLQPGRNGVSGNGGLSMGSPAPDFDLPESSGDRHVRLSYFRGKRPTLLVLGATLVLIFVLIWGL